MIKFLIKQKIVRQFVKFCMVGVVNTIIDYAVYLFFSRLVGLYFLYANIIAILVAMTFSFVINKYWTFRNKENKLKSQYVKFALVNSVYFIINNSIFFALVNYFEVLDLWSKLVAIIIGTFWNFFANRYWTFNDKKTAIIGSQE